MHSEWYEISTLSPVILTRDSATVGVQEGLDYIPGGALLGAVAARLYAALGEDAIPVFHEGKVRFGDALPAPELGQAVAPVPLSFHKRKGASKDENWKNLAVESRQEEGQPKQERGGYLSAALRGPYKPTHESSERTAMQGDTVREGFLYSLHALSAGQRFLCQVEYDPALTSATREAVAKVLAGPELRVGRSRSAEFGLVRIQRVAKPPADFSPAVTASERVPVLLTSDWCLLDLDTGAPTFTFSPKHLGLAEGAFTVDPERSFVATRRYSPFNSKRRRPSEERQVLVRGSVLTLKLGAGTDLIALCTAIARGVGQHLGEGLGRALVAPAFLQASSVDLTPVLPAKAAQPELKDHSLFKWVETRAAQTAGRDVLLDVARGWQDDLRKRFKKSDNSTLVTRAQWGKIRAMTQATPLDSTLLAEIRKYLASEAGLSRDQRKGGVARTREGWGQEDKEGTSLGEALLAMVTEQMKKKPETAAFSLQILASLMVRPEEKKA